MEQAVLNEIDKALRWLNELPSQYRNAGTASQLFMQMMTKTGVDFPWIERRLRHLDTHIYLIAAPRSHLEPGLQISEDKPHWLWVCVNSAEEAEQTMDHFGLLDKDENLRNLADTGWLIVADKSKLPDSVTPVEHLQ